MPYYNVDEVETAVANLAAAYPALARTIELPEPSVEGRRAHALHLTTDHRARRDAVLVIAGVHGCEWGSCEIAINVAADLLSAYAAGAGLAYDGRSFAAREIQALLNRRDLVLFPLVNPDGRLHSQTAPAAELWRKNRNRTSARESDRRTIGVDINRNFDFLFDPAAFAPNVGLSGSSNPAGSTFRGPHAFSEPETRNVRSLLDTFTNVRWFVDLHCTGPRISYVWSDDEAQPHTPAMNFRNPQFDGQRGDPGAGYGEFLAAADLAQMQALAARFVADLQAVRGTQYKSGAAFELNPLSGTSHDYAYARHLVDANLGKVLAFVVEWGDFDTQPPWADMEPIVKEVSAGLIGLCMAT